MRLSALMQVEWGSEQDCFRTMAEELSNFYCFRPNPFEADTSRTSAESAEGYVCSASVSEP